MDKVVDYVRKLLVGVLLAGSLGGCAKFDHVAFSDVKGATDRAELSGAGITIVDGYAVAGTAVAIDSDGDPMEELTLHADEGGVIGVAPGPDEKTYVFFARGVGNGVIRVRVEGDQVGTIAVNVVAQ